MNWGTEAKIWIGIQHIEPINKTEQTLLKALLLVGIKGFIWKYSFYLFSSHFITPSVLKLLSSWCTSIMSASVCWTVCKTLWQVMVLCLAVTQVPFGWCNPALGMLWVCTTGIFYVWYSEHRVALVESPLDHCFFSPHYKLHPLDVVALPMQIIFNCRNPKCSFL